MKISSESSKKKTKSFKHLKVLRKVLSKGYTGHLFYETNTNTKGQIQVTAGDISDDASTMQQLQSFLTQNIKKCRFVSDNIEEKNHATSPPLALSKVLSTLHWDHDTLEALKTSFANLPPFKVTMVPMHRYAYDDGLTYLLLYQESLKKKNFTAKDFFKSRGKSTSLEQQVKVLVLGYCLGLINLKKTAVKNKPTKAMNQSTIARRILKKIMG